MVHLTLSSLTLALDDLLTKRLGALESFAAGKTAVPFLTLRRDRIAALPAELRGLPLAEELAMADDRHDGFGSVVWLSTEAVFRHPEPPPGMREAAEKIRAAFIPSLEALRARYDVEAKTAKDNEPSITKLDAELKLLKAPTGETLHQLVTAFIAEGKKLDLLLSDRADAKSRKEATTLRAEVIGKLNRLRADLADEQKDDPSLPADIEEQVFGYVDLLVKKDANAAEKAKAEKVKAKAEKAQPEQPPKDAGAATPPPPASPPQAEPPEPTP